MLRSSENFNRNYRANICMDKILIIGAGSIGTLIGASLLKAGFDVTFAGRSGSAYTAKIKRHGLSILYPSGEQFWIASSRARIRFVDTDEELKEKFKLIIVAVKSHHLASVTSYIRSHSTKDTILFHAQNGIPYWWFDDSTYLSSLNPTLLNKFNTCRYLNSVDRDGKILESLGDRTLVGCVIKAPCGKTASNKIEVKKPPKMIIGLTKSESNYQQKQKIWQLCNLFSTYGLETSYTTKIRAEVCNKLAINISTNVLSALTGCIISELTSNFYINKLIENILSEINKIFQFYAIEKANLPTREKIYSYIKQPGSQKHLPSLAQDFSQHKQGEVSLIAALVEMAQIAEIQIPILFSLSQLLWLGQTYALNNSNEQFNLLTFDQSSAHFLPSDRAWKSNTLSELDKSNLFTCLEQINLFALERKAA